MLAIFVSLPNHRDCWHLNKQYNLISEALGVPDNILDAAEEFYNIFGPELKAVTGEPKRIEEVLQKVRNLVSRIKSVSVN